MPPHIVVGAGEQERERPIGDGEDEPYVDADPGLPDPLLVDLAQAESGMKMRAAESLGHGEDDFERTAAIVRSKCPDVLLKPVFQNDVQPS